MRNMLSNASKKSNLLIGLSALLILVVILGSWGRATLKNSEPTKKNGGAVIAASLNFSMEPRENNVTMESLNGNASKNILFEVTEERNSTSKKVMNENGTAMKNVVYVAESEPIVIEIEVSESENLGC